MASPIPADNKTTNVSDATTQGSQRTSQPTKDSGGRGNAPSSGLNDAHQSNVSNTTDSKEADLDTASKEATTGSGYNRAGVRIGGQEGAEQKPVRRGPDKFGGRAQE